MDITTTRRGFDLIEFSDHYDIKCSLQKSSLATEDAIWFGCNDADPRRLIPNQGWHSIPMPEGYVADTRMHLTRDQVAALLPHLQRFVETGHIAVHDQCQSPAPNADKPKDAFPPDWNE